MKLQFILGFLGGRRQKVNVYWGGDKCFEVVENNWSGCADIM